jgi:ssDNA thymidine ADP-ribosyltransferase, DarT
VRAVASTVDPSPRMTQRPIPTKIYHITHIENLSSIVEAGGLLSDAKMIERGGPGVAVGMGEIKRRRLGLPVKCHPGGMVGEYVPFFFCPRSIMLYIFHMDNREGLSYHGGQRPIVHLELDVDTVIEAADEMDIPWAFTNANAATLYAEFGSSIEEFGMIDWEAVPDNDFRSGRVKEAKQSEFLVKDFVPWKFVEQVGVYSDEFGQQAVEAFAAVDHRPPVVVQSGWYF